MKLLSSILNFFTNMKLISKILLLFFVGILLVGATSLFSIRYLISNYNEVLYTRSAESLSTVINSFQNSVRSYEELADRIATDSSVQEYLTILLLESDPIQKKDAITQLSRQFTYYNSLIDSIVCIKLNYGENDIIAGKRSLTDSPQLHQKLMETSFAADGRTAFLNTDMEEAGLACTKLIKKTDNFDLRPLGTLTIYIDLPQMLKQTKSSISAHTDMEIYLYFNDVQLHPDDFSLPPEVLSKITRKSSYQITKIEQTRYFVVGQTLPSSPFLFAMIIDYDRLFHTQKKAGFAVFFIVAAVTFTVSLLFVLIIGNQLKHLSFLLDKIHYYKKNSNKPAVVPYDYTDRNDEIGILHNEFDDMIDKINLLIEDNYVKQLIIKDAQIKALEQQMNPHFLYNTLNLISWEAEALEAPTIPVIVESLSFLLRNILSEKSALIPLKKELALIKHYITIQQLRFTDRLSYEQDIDPTLELLLVPKLSIQPLVENAIKYALERNPEPCRIIVTGKKRKEHVQIEVSNTGSCIDCHILEKLLSGETIPQGFGIGLTNIDARIRTLCGEQYGLRFRQENDTAVVILILPLQTPATL